AASILANSPELFLRRRGDRVETRPIKGTRPRGDGRAHDAALAAELEADAKERAEHVMIVDLERNDLGRVAAVGSVAVEAYARVESHPTVHHLVSSVVGRVRRSEEHTSELQSRGHLVCRLLLEKKKKIKKTAI